MHLQALTASHSQFVGDTAAASLPAMAQLQAQLHYRLGSARGCISIYDKLFQSTKVG